MNFESRTRRKSRSFPRARPCAHARCTQATGSGGLMANRRYLLRFSRLVTNLRTYPAIPWPEKRGWIHGRIECIKMDRRSRKYRSLLNFILSLEKRNFPFFYKIEEYVCQDSGRRMRSRYSCSVSSLVTFQFFVYQFHVLEGTDSSSLTSFHT